MALLKDAKIKEVVEDRYGRKVAKVYVGRYYANFFYLIGTERFVDFVYGMGVESSLSIDF